jgi:hypothetical protein
MLKYNKISNFLGGFIMLKVVPEISMEATVKTKSITKSKRSRSKAMPKKIYIQYAEKEIDHDALIEKFKFEWCKKYRINEIKNLKVYYKIEDKKAYFVANELITIIIDFKSTL